VSKQKEKGPASLPTLPDAHTSTHLQFIASQQVSFWSVHEYVAPLLGAVGLWPMVGTPAWCLLADDDPVKLAALYDAARHWSLRIETCQEALTQASRDASAAADWSVLSREIRQRNDFYAARPWLKRAAS
jgi:hypothetical protein